MAFFALAAALAPSILGAISGSKANKSASKAAQKTQEQTDRANALNDANFKRIFEEFLKREDEARGIFKGLQGSGESEIKRAAEGSRARSKQSLVSRGLANTNRLETDRRGVDSLEAESLERLRRDLAFREIDTLGRFAGERLAFANTATVQGPSGQEIAAIQARQGQGNEALLSGISGIGSTFGDLFKRRSGSVPLATTQQASASAGQVQNFFTR